MPKGLPIGNLTSQLFANIYLHELDTYMKHTLKAKYYARYTDDFIIVHNDPEYLQNLIPKIQHYLKEKLQLSLHPRKVTIRKLSHGISFLGYVVLPYHTVLRTKTKKRMLKKVRNKIYQYATGQLSKVSLNQSLQSYLGVIKHCNGRRIKRQLKRLLPL